jgi:O-antigen/teichoic acid export membrane protein
MGLRKRLASQSAVIFLARIFGAGVIFVAQAAIARFWGADILGEYLLILATVNLIAVVMPLGFETIGTYFAAEYRAKGEGRLLRGFMTRAYGHVALTALVLFAVGYPVTSLLGEPGKVLATYWLPSAIMASATAVVFVNSALLVGLKRPLAGFFADTIFRPMLIIGAFGIAMLAATAETAFGELIWILAVGFAVIALAQLAYVVFHARRVPLEEEVRPAETRRWWRFALPWVVIALASDFFFDLDLILLSGLMSREELAIFGVCTRIFSLASFGVAAVYAVTLPDVFDSHALSDREGFNRKIGEANLVAAGIALGLFVVMSLGGPFLLLLFGTEFVAGAGALAVLCLALVVRSALGPAALVLSIHDRPYASLPAIGLGLVTLAAGNFVLVPRFGLMGAAVAALVAITLWSLAMWFTALKGAGVDVSIRARLRRVPLEANAESGIGVVPGD